MAFTSSLLSGRHNLTCDGSVITASNKTSSVSTPMGHTYYHNWHGWIVNAEGVHTFIPPRRNWKCPWFTRKIDALECVSSKSLVATCFDGVIIGDASGASIYAAWPLACIQRLSRFSTSFDVAWIDPDKCHVYVTCFSQSIKDDVLKFITEHVVHIFELGADPFPWQTAVRTASKEKWEIEDWISVFDDDEEEEDGEEEDDNGEYKPDEEEEDDDHDSTTLDEESSADESGASEADEEEETTSASADATSVSEESSSVSEAEEVEERPSKRARLA